MEPSGTPPPWLRELLRKVEEEPAHRWRDRDVRAMGLHPDRVRRWFRKYHGMTFQTFCRARRMGLALGRIREGSTVLNAAMDHGYDSLSGFNEAFRRILGTPPRGVRGRTIVTVGRIATPLGPMIAGATAEGLCLLEFADRRMLPAQLGRLERYLACAFVPGSSPVILQTATELEQYFAGRRRAFTVPTVTPGTAFQTEVWSRLREVPFGRTVTYAQLAGLIGRPEATRAVARANGDNRIAVIIPCHRVVGSDGKLTGYGGGLWRKQRLLDLEAGRQALLEPSPAT
jgi:AraC family transcriptional regulator of adaptative response/methylated-DNA-[protein]-cysteine methyltransferase